MKENYFSIKENPPEQRHADKYGKVMIAGENSLGE